jgi:hypothetical protein
MNRLLIAMALLGSCIAAANAQSIAPLGMMGGGVIAASPPVGPAGIPLGSTELSVPGLSPGAANGSMPALVPPAGLPPLGTPMGTMTGSMGSGLSGSVAAPIPGNPTTGFATSTPVNPLITNYGTGGMATPPRSPTRGY